MLSLFSGIGGMDLAAKWAGIETVAFCEIEPFCQKVLRKNFGKDIVLFDDVRELTAESLRERGISPESISVVAGGFPCQDVSGAGRRAGIDGARSGLWREMFRLVCELRPRFVIVENTTGLLERGMGRVLGDLASVGFDAEWSVLSACAVGAPHPRERVFIVAYPNGVEWHFRRDSSAFNAVQIRPEWKAAKAKSKWQNMERWLRETLQAGDWQESAAVIHRDVDGLSERMGALKGYGNAVVPQVCYPIFEAIAAIENEQDAA